MNQEPFTPEHDKAKQFTDEMQKIGEFIEWLPSIGIHLGEWVKYPEYMNEQFVTANYNIQELLARFFGIDYKAYQAEKEAVYQYVSEIANGRK